MINHYTETMIRPNTACRLFPGRSGKGISLATCWRWMLRGYRGVKLESLLIGGTRYTSKEAVQRFVEALNRQADQPNGVRASRTALTRRIEHELDLAGFEGSAKRGCETENHEELTG